MARVFVVDNYDSFTFNLVQEMGELGATIEVARNDEITVSALAAVAPDGIVLSPGPGRPESAGITESVIRELGASTPILGVCLGHQAIGQVFGATIVRAPSIMHGKTSEIHHRGVGVFVDLPTPLVATRYHSLVIDPATVPDELEVTAWTNDGVVMGVRHRDYPIEGVQFHPESVLTVDGPQLLANFLTRLTQLVGGQ
jgi:anthranilate synthase component 2